MFLLSKQTLAVILLHNNSGIFTEKRNKSCFIITQVFLTAQTSAVSFLHHSLCFAKTKDVSLLQHQSSTFPVKILTATSSLKYVSCKNKDYLTATLSLKYLFCLLIGCSAATSWVKYLSCQKISCLILTSLAYLSAKTKDVSLLEHHSSMFPAKTKTYLIATFLKYLSRKYISCSITALPKYLSAKTKDSHNCNITQVCFLPKEKQSHCYVI